MNALIRLSVTLGLVGIAAAVPAQTTAQDRIYNAATETTLNGTVETVVSVPAAGPQAGGLHLTLNTGSATIEIHVGPIAFVSSKNVSFAVGDTLIVVGSKVAIEGQEVLIARQITKGDQILTLRNADGIPLWAGRGRGR